MRSQRNEKIHLGDMMRENFMNDFHNQPDGGRSGRIRNNDKQTPSFYIHLREARGNDCFCSSLLHQGIPLPPISWATE